MHDIRKIDIQENILAENERMADELRSYLSARDIAAINVMGAPGAGKTSAIRGLIAALSDRKSEDGKAPHCYVIEGDIESDIDTRTFRALGVDARQINTFGACHLDAPMLGNMIYNSGFDEPGFLFIENVGNLVCPAEFTIGEHFLLLVSSVAEGSDKPYKYPLAFEKADMILLNKTDLIPYLDFDADFFERGVRALNKRAPLIRVSAKSGEGFEAAAEIIRDGFGNGKFR